MAKQPHDPPRYDVWGRQLPKGKGSGPQMRDQAPNFQKDKGFRMGRVKMPGAWKDRLINGEHNNSARTNSTFDDTHAQHVLMEKVSRDFAGGQNTLGGVRRQSAVGMLLHASMNSDGGFRANPAHHTRSELLQSRRESLTNKLEVGRRHFEAAHPPEPEPPLPEPKRRQESPWEASERARLKMMNETRQVGAPFDGSADPHRKDPTLAYVERPEVPSRSLLAATRAKACHLYGINMMDNMAVPEYGPRHGGPTPLTFKPLGMLTRMKDPLDGGLSPINSVGGSITKGKGLTRVRTQSALHEHRRER